MKRWGLMALVVCLVLGSGPIGVGAQDDARPPTIFTFESDLESVTMADLEGGTAVATFNWHVAHITEAHELRLEMYRLNAWESVLQQENALNPVGNLMLSLEHPGNFGPPTFRLSIVDADDNRLDERTLVIPYDMAAMEDLTPSLVTFTSPSLGVDPAVLDSGLARVPVMWQVMDRLPLSNLIFEQVLPDGSARIAELPRMAFWVDSGGTGVVAPIRPPTAAGAATAIQLRLRVVDVISGDVYDEALLDLPIRAPGEGAEAPAAAPATEAAPATATPEPTATPLVSAETAPGATGGQPETPQHVATTIDEVRLETDCPSMSATGERGWIDGGRIMSPNGRYVVWVTNDTTGATLTIQDTTNPTDTVVIDAPNTWIPLDRRPKFSPDADNSRLAFGNIALSQPGGGTIYVANVDGSRLAQVATYTGYYDEIAWSGDGTRLFFTDGEAVGQGSSTQVVNYKVMTVEVAGGIPNFYEMGCLLPPTP